MLSSLFGAVKKLLLILFCLSALVFGGLFTYENPEKITPVVLGYEFPSLPLGIYLAAVLLVGVLLGFVISLWGSQAKQIRLKRENARLRKASVRPATKQIEGN